MLRKNDFLRWLITGSPRVVRRRRKTSVTDKLRYQKYKSEARALVLSKLEKYNKMYGFKYGRISIRNQKTRWGSCSKKGNLNFNYKVVFLPEELVDYIIVHELCHLKEFNHSACFWSLVAQVFPNYLKLRSNLRKVRLDLNEK